MSHNKALFIVCFTALLAVLAVAQTPPPDKVWAIMYQPQAYNQRSSTFQIEANNLPVSYGEEFLLSADFTGIVFNRDTTATIPNKDGSEGTQLAVDVLQVDVITQYVVNGTYQRDINTEYVLLQGGSAIVDFPITFMTRKQSATSSHRLFFTIMTSQIADNASIDIKLTQQAGFGTKYRFVQEKPYTIPGYTAKFANSLEVKYRKPNNKADVQNYDKSNGGFEFEFKKLSQPYQFNSTSLQVTTSAGDSVQFTNVAQSDQLHATNSGNCQFKWKKESFEVAFVPTNRYGEMVWASDASATKVIPADSDVTILCPGFDVQFKNQTYVTQDLTFDFIAASNNSTNINPNYEFSSASVVVTRFDKSREKSGLSGVAIFFIIFAIIAVLLVVLILAVRLCKKNRNRENKQELTGQSMGTY